MSVEKHSKHILLVDSEDELRALIRDLLSRIGIHTTEARNGEEALKILAQASDSIPLVLCDFQLRDDGFELPRQIRQLYPHTSLVILSVYDDQERYIEALKIGALDYLPKPFKVEEFIERVQKAFDLATRRLTRAHEQEQDILSRKK